MGWCRYRFNPSETYQMTKPGTAPETHCGAVTYAAADEPEMTVIRDMVPDGDSGMRPVDRWVHSGRYVTRSDDDPYCPQHGGVEEPALPQVTLTEIQAARRQYEQLVTAFGMQPPALAGLTPEVLALTRSNE